MIFVALMAGTFAVFLALNITDAGAHIEGTEGRPAEVTHGFFRRIGGWGGALILFAAYAVEGIAYALMLDRFTDGGAGEYFFPKTFILIACLLTVAYFYAGMIF